MEDPVKWLVIEPYRANRLGRLLFVVCCTKILGSELTVDEEEIGASLDWISGELLSVGAVLPTCCLLDVDNWEEVVLEAVCQICGALGAGSAGHSELEALKLIEEIQTNANENTGRPKA